MGPSFNTSNRDKETQMTSKQLTLNVVLCLGLTILGSAVFGNTSNSTRAISVDDLHQGLILHMSFDRDETGSNPVTDTSGQNNHGKASGVRWTAQGKIGGAYEFTTDGDQIEISNNASVNPKRLTASAWIKTSHRDDKWRRIFDKSYSQGYALCIAGDYQGNSWRGQVSLEIGPGRHYSLSRSMIADGQWHHVVATCDGTEQIIFIDGRPEGRPLQWATPGEIGTTDFNLVIGCNRSNVGEDDFGVSFRGLIDEPMMWNRALSVPEVEFLYQSQGGKLEEQTSRAKDDNQNEIALLKGIVHLTDNDVRFQRRDGIRVFVDPVSFPSDRQVVESGLVKPDLILITHSHNDHFMLSVLREYLRLNPEIILAGPPDVVGMAKKQGIKVAEIKPNQSYTMAGIKFDTVPACFLEGDSHPKAKGWMGYVLHLDESSYYVTGDTQALPEMEKLQVDVIFPLLYGCGGNADQAVKMARLCKAKLVVSVHHNDQQQSIKEFITKLPDTIQSNYFLGGKLVPTP
jgi:L-ascorbate metabolism protein UlaG (beta-lactamase superfamily)